MNAMLTKLAARMGLVPARRYAALQRAADESRAVLAASKAKSEKLSEKLERTEAELKRHMRHLRHARADVEKLQQRAVEFDKISEQLVQAEEALALAREQLTAIEVKLDILEGAANILDTRTRTSRQQQPGPTTGAAV